MHADDQYARSDTVIYLDASCAVDTTSGTLGLAIHPQRQTCAILHPSLDEYYSDSELPVLTCTGDDADKQGSYSFTRTFYSAATDALWLDGRHVRTALQTIHGAGYDWRPPSQADSVYTISCEFYDAATLYAVTCVRTIATAMWRLQSTSSTEQSGTCPCHIPEGLQGDG